MVATKLRRFCLRANPFAHTTFYGFQRVLIQENLKDISADVQCLVAILYMIPIDISIIQ